MLKGLMDEIINLKEERRVLKAECEGGINENTFSKEEMEHIRTHKNEITSCRTLEGVEEALAEDEKMLINRLK